MSGLLFRADELRDADTRYAEYERRKAWVTAAVKRMPQPRYSHLARDDTEAWWLRTRLTIQQTVARTIRGQRAAVEVRQRWERLPNLIRRLKNNIHPLRSIK
jgi:hypothetical protein